ncbi:hypothetical protein JOD24_000340 [Kroppenstedtia sanguinis]|uniref:Uncharacterized protein n=1 Tax=Kroppenstedtia sanguinis TaxID=1380684 RepID=A0ABW4C5Y8_9BACL
MELLEILFSNGIVTVLLIYLVLAGLSRLFRRGGDKGEEARRSPESPTSPDEPRKRKQQMEKGPSIIEAKERLIPEEKSGTPTIRIESDPPIPVKKKTVPSHPLISDINQRSMKQAIIMKEVLDGPRFRRGGNRRGPLGR